MTDKRATVTVEYEGRLITGTWNVRGDTITLHAPSGERQSRKVLKQWGPDTHRMIAGSILREMAKNGLA
jgi:hypothetical protein